MKHILYTIVKILIFAALSLCSSLLQARNDRDTLGLGARILFSENKGQWNDRVLFRSQMHASTLFVERDCFTFVVEHPDNPNLHHPGHADASNPKRTPSSFRTHAYRMRFEGCSTTSVEGTERQAGYENYFLGRDQSRWTSNVGVFQSVLYHNLYSGIDLKVYAASNAMKYDFIVYPGANPSAISISYEGTEGVRLSNGNIVVHTSVVDIVELRPYAYQIVDGTQREVEARFRLKEGRLSFELGRYDTTQTLIIDPYLYFSTYTGSTADNWGTTGCYDSYKNTYTSGLVFSNGYPTSLGAYDGSYNGNADIGIFKFDTTGSIRLYATYLGGSYADMPHSTFVNSLDELVIFGTTGSANFPVTPGAYDTSFNGGTPLQYENSSTINFPNGSDIFICRFSSDGTQLQASTFIGGSGNDGLNYRNSFDYNTVMIGNDSLYFNYGDGARGEIITDDLNNIYVGSTTSSTDFPVSANCIQGNNSGRQDGIVLKIDYNLAHLMWSTYLGGIKDDAIYSIDCDNDYNVIVTGGTNSPNFPTTPGSYRNYYSGGSADAFVTKISYYGNVMMASTMFGSTSYDQSYFVRCGKTGDVFIFGQTKAPGSTLIHNANYNTPNSGQFLARFTPALDSLKWSTVFGDGSGSPNISPTAFAVDICNRIYLSGWGRIFLGFSWNGTTYPWFSGGTSNLTVTPDAYQSSTDGQDFYIMSLDIDANNLVYATFFGEQHSSAGNYYSGSDHVDGGTSRFDRLGTIYQSVCASCSQNDNFPVTTGAYSQHNNSNNCNNAIFRLNLTDDFPVAEFNYTRSDECDPTTITFHNTGRGTSYLWDFGDGQTSTDANPTHVYAFAGFYTVRLIAFMPGGCRESDTTEHTITILSGTNVPQLDTLRTCPGSTIQIGLQPEVGLTYHWTVGEVSDSNIANPTTDQTGVFSLWIMTGNNYGCGKMVQQVVLAGETEAHIVGNPTTCSVPTTLDIEAQGNNITYQWSSNRDLTDTLNSDMGSGSYSFDPSDVQWLYMHVTDDRGCYKTDSIQISFTQIVDSILLAPPSCPGSCDASAVVVQTSFAQEPVQHWISEYGGTDPQYSYSALCPGSYTYHTIDANNCQVATEFTIPDRPAPVVSFDVMHIACQESCTGQVSVSVNGPSLYQFLWLDDSSTASSRSNLCPGVYVIQITDTNGCTFIDSVEVLENVDLSLSLSIDRAACAGMCNGSATALLTGGQDPCSYQWSTGETTATALNLCPGMVHVVATDANGCQKHDSIMIPALQSFDSMHVWADADFVFNGQSTTLHVTPISGATYWWSPSDLLDNPASTNPVATLEDSTVFYVTATDSLGCTHTDSVAVGCINVDCGETNIFIPNAFTPNNDGKNDCLCISGEWVDDFHIAIFTRWGEKVYESDNITQCWDGRFRDNWCMPGVYVYYCRIKCANGQLTQLKGDVTLIR